MYLPLRDAKLLSRDSIYELYTKEVNLLLRMPKLLRRDSIYKVDINTVYLLLRDAKRKGFHLQVKNKHLLLVDANLLLADSILPIAILRFLLPYALIIERSISF